MHVPRVRGAEAEVLQDGKLVGRGRTPATFPVRDLEKPLRVFVGPAGASSTLDPLGREGFALFKLGSDARRGRLSRALRGGLYVALVPRTWSPAGSLALAPAASVRELPGWVAYEFEYAAGAPAPAFVDDTGSRREVSPRERPVQLSGTHLEVPGGGVIFREAPMLHASPQVWSRIATVVVVEEDAAGVRMRVPFRPDPRFADQPLPRRVAEARCGRFTVRVYDRHQRLIQSEDFRFAAGLEEMRWDVSRWPRRSASPDQLVMRGPDELRVEVVPVALREATLIGTGPRVNIEIPREPVYDDLRVTIDLGGRRVRFPARLQRAWWAVTEDSRGQPEWAGSCIVARRRLFEPGSTATLKIKLPHRPDSGDELGTVRVAVDGKPLPGPLSSGPRGELVVPMRELALSPAWSEDRDVHISAIGSGGQVLAELARVPVAKYLCLRGDFTAGSRRSVFEHAWTQHPEALYRSLKYDEILQHEEVLDLPKHIYQCPNCQQVISDRASSSVAEEHLKHCPKPQRVNGKLEISLRVIVDPDIIRERCVTGLPWWLGCAFCDCVFRGSTADDAKAQVRKHLWERHSREIAQVI